MLTSDEQIQIEKLAAEWVRAALVAQRAKRETFFPISPKTAQATLARARANLRDYLKDAG